MTNIQTYSIILGMNDRLSSLPLHERARLAINEIERYEKLRPPSINDELYQQGLTSIIDRYDLLSEEGSAALVSITEQQLHTTRTSQEITNEKIIRLTLTPEGIIAWFLDKFGN